MDTWVIKFPHQGDIIFSFDVSVYFIKLKIFNKYLSLVVHITSLIQSKLFVVLIAILNRLEVDNVMAGFMSYNANAM